MYFVDISKNDYGIYCDVEGAFGDSNFGGVNFDIVLMEEILKKNNIINDDINNKKLRLQQAYEKCKIKLSNEKFASVIIDNFISSKKNININEYFTINDFLKICNPLFEKFKQKLKEFITVCNIEDKIQLISNIILVGGSTKIPRIKQLIKESFPWSIIREDLDPCTSVAIGAAIHASMITSPEIFDNYNLLDVTNLSLGTNVYNKEEKLEIMDIIIKRSSKLPAYGTKNYKTHEDYQTFIINDIYEGEKKELSDNLYLGTLKICDLTPAKKGKTNIKLDFKIDTNSILEIKAIELSSNKKEVKIEIPEIAGIEEKELNNLKNEELEAELVIFPDYDSIRNNIVENQEKIKSDKIYEENINMLTSLLKKVKPETINKQLYLPYIRYIFSLLNLIKNPNLLKKKFKDLLINIQFIDEKELLEILEDSADNNLIEHYFLSAVIKYYYSKMKEFYLKSQLNECKERLEFIEKLLQKIPYADLIKELKTEIDLFRLKIEIREFLLNYEAYTSSIAKEKAEDYKKKIGNNYSFFYNEIEQLSKINNQFEDIQKRISSRIDGKNDANELMYLLKFKFPKIKTPQKKSEEDFRNEIETYINQYDKNKKPKTKEERDFRKIFCKDGILLINADNESLYIKGRKEKEEKITKKYNDSFQKYKKYANDHEEIRIDFLNNPYDTLLFLISLYQKEEIPDQDNLCYLHQLKDKYRNISDEIQKLKKENDLDLASILRKFPPFNRMHDKERDKLDKRENLDYLSKLKIINSIYENKEYNKKNFKEKFDYFKIFCEIYQISYIKSEYTKREYLSILNEVKPIRKEFEDRGFRFANLYERKILDPNSVNIYI